MGSVWHGKSLELSLFGESHGACAGCVLDGFPAGMEPDLKALEAEMARRRPGGKLASLRREADAVEILSGLYEGFTSGAPICAIIRNEGARSEEYASFRDIPRPGHADYTQRVRYANRHDARGGGHLSGRLTAPLVFAGALAKQALAKCGIEVCGRVAGVGGVEDEAQAHQLADPRAWNALIHKTIAAFSDDAALKMEAAVLAAKGEGDSLGGVIEAVAFGVPAGWGSPIFDNVESRVAALLFAIPGVKGVSFGAAALSKQKGSEANDDIVLENGVVRHKTNNAGGINGGITNGMPLAVRAEFRPAPSIAKPQTSADMSKNQQTILAISGRHDPCIALRAMPVAEACLALALLDLAIEMEGVLRWTMK